MNATIGLAHSKHYNEYLIERLISNLLVLVASSVSGHSTGEAIECRLGMTGEDWYSREVLVRLFIFGMMNRQICRDRSVWQVVAFVFETFPSFTVNLRDG